MRVLILDDEFERHQAFRRVYLPARENTIISAQRFSDFVRELSDDQVFDLIYLDHDLGDKASGADFYLDGWGQPNCFDGYDAVSEIIALKIEVPQIIIHSNNNVRAPGMVSDLKRFGYDAVWEPFSL